MGVLSRVRRQLNKLDDVVDDNVVFRLHYQITVWIFLIAGFVLGLIHYTTEKIVCTDYSKITNEMCWSHGTLTITSLSSSTKRIVQREFSGNATITPIPPPAEDLRRYQLVFCKLILHAVFFYLPRVLWKLWEGDKVKVIAKDLERNVAKETGEFIEKTAVSIMADYVRKHSSVLNARLVAFAFCELLNFINVVSHLTILDGHLGDVLSTHGVDVIGLTNVDYQHTRTDSLIAMFPRLVNCRFSLIGDRGNLEIQSLICVLPNNSLNEKLIAVILIWLLILSVVSGLALIYRAVVVTSAAARLHILGARCRHLPHNKVARALRGAGEWFLLYQLSKNVGVITFTELVKELGYVEDDGKNAVV